MKPPNETMMKTSARDAFFAYTNRDQDNHSLDRSLCDSVLQIARESMKDYMQEDYLYCIVDTSLKAGWGYGFQAALEELFNDPSIHRAIEKIYKQINAIPLPTESNDDGQSSARNGSRKRPFLFPEDVDALQQYTITNVYTILDGTVLILTLDNTFDFIVDKNNKEKMRYFTNSDDATSWIGMRILIYPLSLKNSEGATCSILQIVDAS